MKSGGSPQKLRKYRWQTPIRASICTPVAPSLLISLGRRSSLGGHNFCLEGAQAVIWGGARPWNAPPWRPGSWNSIMPRKTTRRQPFDMRLCNGVHEKNQHHLVIKISQLLLKLFYVRDAKFCDAKAAIAETLVFMKKINTISS